MIICPNCGMSTWKDKFGCTLPGCENYEVLVEDVWLSVEDDSDYDDDYADATTPDEVWSEGGIKD